jgi:hypothetical protein
MKDLAQYTKDLGLVEKYWEKHMHLTEVADLLSNVDIGLVEKPFQHACL